MSNHQSKGHLATYFDQTFRASTGIPTSRNKTERLNKANLIANLSQFVIS
jgi:hypothetical protein